VESKEGHLAAFTMSEIEAVFATDPAFYRPNHEDTSSALWRVVENDAIGELLGYGSRTLNAPDNVRVLISDGQRVVTGFWAPRATAERIARQRAFDYGFYLQRDLTISIGD